MSFFYVKLDNSGYYLLSKPDDFNNFVLQCIAAEYDQVMVYVKNAGKLQQQCVPERLIDCVGNFNFIIEQLAKYSHTQVSSQHDLTDCVIMCNHGDWDVDTMGVIGIGKPFTTEDEKNILITHNANDFLTELRNEFEIDCLCNLDCVAVSFHSISEEAVLIRSYHR